MRLVIVFFIVMAALGMVDEEEIQQVCSMRETILGRVLQDWERKVVGAHLQNEKLKAMNQEERAHVPNFDKVITFMFVRHNLNILMEKVIKSASNRFDALKRRPDFDESILPARKVAKSAVFIALTLLLDQVPSEPSAAGARRGVRSVPVRSVPSQRSH